MIKKEPGPFQGRKAGIYPRIDGKPGVHGAVPKPVLSMLAAILMIWGLTAACVLTSGLKGSRAIPTDTVQVDLTQSIEFVQGTLSALATQTAQALPPSPTPIPPSPTASPVPPTATESLPSSTPGPSPTPAKVTGEIKFRSGGTSAYLQKPIRVGDRHLFTVRALKDQTLILTVASPDNDVYLDVKGGIGDQHLLSADSRVSSWSARLPQTQEYIISLTTQNPDTYYFLSVEVPANIYFDPGAYSDTISGYIDVDEDFHPDVLTRVRYLARALSGQTMTVALTSDNLDDLSVGIFGQEDGQVYLNYQVKNSGGEVDLPETQGYYIDVYAVSGESTSFTLKVTIK